MSDPKKPMTEDQEQTKLATWLDKRNILYFAIPNGGKRHLLEAMKMKRTGVKAGVPDIFIPVARKIYHGLFIELKRKDGGQVSDRQRWWLGKLIENGYLAVISHGADEAIAIVNDYLYPEDEPPMAA